MPRFEQPKPVRTAGYLLLGLVAVGVFQAVAGYFELRHLDANLATLQERSTMLADALRSADRMRGSAELALGAGATAAVLMLLFRFLYLRAFVIARPLAWIACGIFLFTQILLMLQDGSIGVQPYIDISHDQAQEDMVNSLIVWPGYFFLLYPAEAAGLVLPVLVGAQLIKEDTIEFFRLRKKVTAEKTWDVQEILDKRVGG